jgi:hypothetical protein
MMRLGGKSHSTWNDVFLKEDAHGDEWTKAVIST